MPHCTNVPDLSAPNPQGPQYHPDQSSSSARNADAELWPVLADLEAVAATIELPVRIAKIRNRRVGVSREKTTRKRVPFALQRILMVIDSMLNPQATGTRITNGLCPFNRRYRVDASPGSGRDYYQILGVPDSAAPDEIRRAFRIRARFVHPDRHREESKAVQNDAERQFKLLNEAHEVLSDAQRREAYDEARRRPHPSDDPSLAADFTAGVRPVLLEVEPTHVSVSRHGNTDFRVDSLLTTEDPVAWEQYDLEADCDDGDVELNAIELRATRHPHQKRAVVTCRVGLSGPQMFVITYLLGIGKTTQIVDTRTIDLPYVNQTASDKPARINGSCLRIVVGTLIMLVPLVTFLIGILTRSTPEDDYSLAHQSDENATPKGGTSPSRSLSIGVPVPDESRLVPGEQQTSYWHFECLVGEYISLTISFPVNRRFYGHTFYLPGQDGRSSSELVRREFVDEEVTIAGY